MVDLVYPSATRDQGSTEDNGLNMIQNFSDPSILPAKKNTEIHIRQHYHKI
ncbi:hypothetical protein G436_0812 [Leptospira interrogans serovar Hardjo str. Norma]|uniref:Uncharacterized protein n=1 Tax=Leptospira interrogans serovar Hardjo str. Norma TaxID=1279460 RepID=A0A0M4NVZ0_LEPIR|nr:hypothetical protein G436_0812 [Leptospira interrogans serovar Hardjo str. Norma]